MQSQKVIIKNKVGLRARAAALFVQTASKFFSDIHIEMKDKKINGKSIMGIMALGASKDDEIALITQGEDEKEALEALIQLIEDKLTKE